MGKQRNNIAVVYFMGWVLGGLAAYPSFIFANDNASLHPGGGQVVGGEASIGISPIIQHTAPLPPSSAQVVGGEASIGINPIIQHNAPLHPSGGQVVGGEASIGINPTNPYHQIIEQSTPSAIIDWNTFSIGEGSTTQFNQPGPNSVTLNRVTGGFPSDISGTLKANGHLFLINPKGITIWKTGKIDMPGVLGTTSNISNQDFLAGKYHFRKAEGSDNFAVINYGEISVKEGGLVALVAPGAANYGVIRTRLSRITLAEGTDFVVADFHGDRLIQFAVNQPSITSQVKTSDGKPFKHAVNHTGTIDNEGGKIVFMSTGAVKNVLSEVINTTGVIRANTAARGKHGEVILYDAGSAARGSGDKGIVKVAGPIEARGNRPGETGGTVVITGKRVQGGNHIDSTLFNNLEIQPQEKFSIDVSGQAGGGTILFGGNAHKESPTVVEAQLRNPEAASPMTRGHQVQWPDFFIDNKQNNEVPAAEATILGKEVSLIANALKEGSGGELIVTSAMTRIPGSSSPTSTSTSTLTSSSSTSTSTSPSPTSEGLTRIYGSQSANGGPEGGHGGYIQNCGDWIDVRSAVEVGVAQGTAWGKPGLWYVDPFNVTVNSIVNLNGNFNPVNPPAGGTTVWTPNASPSEIDFVPSLAGPFPPAYLNTGRNVTIRTSGGGGAEPGDIGWAPDPPGTVTGVGTTLTLSADNNISFNGPLNAAGLNLALVGLNVTNPGAPAFQITVATMSLNVTTSFNMGNTPGAPSAFVNGNSTGSNITLLNTFGPGTHFFNGHDLFQYLPVTPTPSTPTANNVIISTLNPSNNNTTGGSPSGTTTTSAGGTDVVTVTPPSPPPPAPAPAAPAAPAPAAAAPTSTSTAAAPSSESTTATSTTSTSTGTTSETATAATGTTEGTSTGAGSQPVETSVSATAMIGGGAEGREIPMNAEGAGGREGVAEGAFNNPDAFEKTEAVTASCPANVEGAKGSISRECLEKPLGGAMSREDIAKALGEDKKAPISPEGVDGVDAGNIGGDPLGKEKIMSAEAAGGDESLVAKSAREWSIEDINRTPEYLENLGPELSKKNVTQTKKELLETIKSKAEILRKKDEEAIPQSKEMQETPRETTVKTKEIKEVKEANG